MKISLVLATYNGEKYLKKQLDSIINQTTKIDEIIIVDDCSIDETVNIVTKYIRNNNLMDWKFVVNDENLGYRKNFRKAISMATGDIIFLCDQDDIWSKYKVEKMINVLKDKRVYSLASSFYFIDKNGKKFKIKKKVNKSNNNLLEQRINKKLTKIGLNILLKNNFSQGCTMAFNKLLRDEYLRYSEGKLPHDWEINLLASIHNGCYYMDEELIGYRIHEENTIGLDSITNNSIVEKKSKRISDRVKLTVCEKEVVEFVLQLDMLDIDKRIFCERYRSYLNKRIEIFHSKSIKSSLSFFLSGGYKEFGHFKTVVGDIIAVIL